MKMEGVFRSLLAGGLAGCISWALPYPVDVIKSKIQADGLAGKPYKYSGILDCAKQMQMQEGWRVFFRYFYPFLVLDFLLKIFLIQRNQCNHGTSFSS